MTRTSAPPRSRTSSAASWRRGTASPEPTWRWSTPTPGQFLAVAEAFWRLSSKRASDGPSSCSRTPTEWSRSPCRRWLPGLHLVLQPSRLRLKTPRGGGMSTSGRVPAVPLQSRIFQRTALLTCTFTTHGCTALSRSQCASMRRVRLGSSPQRCPAPAGRDGVRGQGPGGLRRPVRCWRGGAQAGRSERPGGIAGRTP